MKTTIWTIHSYDDNETKGVYGSYKEALEWFTDGDPDGEGYENVEIESWQVTIEGENN